MDIISPSTAQEGVWMGFIPFGLCSIWGLNILRRGLSGEIQDATGHNVASRTWFIRGWHSPSNATPRIYSFCMETRIL